jgi:hypothetical protein
MSANFDTYCRDCSSRSDVTPISLSESRSVAAISRILTICDPSQLSRANAFEAGEALTIDDPFASSVRVEQKFSISSNSRAILSRNFQSCVRGVYPGLEATSSPGDVEKASVGDSKKALEHVSNIVLWM